MLNLDMIYNVRLLVTLLFSDGSLEANFYNFRRKTNINQYYWITYCIDLF